MGAKTAVAPGQWVALSAGPLAWSVTLLANYVLVARACSAELLPVLHGIAAAMLVPIAVAAVAGWRALAAASREDAGDANAGRPSQESFVARLTLLSCAMFAFAIVAQAVPPWLLHDCH